MRGKEGGWGGKLREQGGGGRGGWECVCVWGGGGWNHEIAEDGKGVESEVGERRGRMRGGCVEDVVEEVKVGGLEAGGPSGPV